MAAKEEPSVAELQGKESMLQSSSSASATAVPAEAAKKAALTSVAAKRGHQRVSKSVPSRKTRKLAVKVKEMTKKTKLVASASASATATATAVVGTVPAVANCQAPLKNSNGCGSISGYKIPKIKKNDNM